MKLSSLKIPRCISSGHTEGEIHMFVDTNERSYAAAVYWRVKLNENKSTVSLIIGKAHVTTPLKIMSISQLELQAYYLRFTHSDPRSFKSFVAHRLAESEEQATIKSWRWVPTKVYVAYNATRGPLTDFDERHRVPNFLRKNEDKWP
ncbi:hypothetical protein EVAR_92236_1 [Eumeta japonica]|uniref:Uncharacterized protein n=1 Tax=Eumeta variegata TaxID=151549 RepID=A0A4C1TL57_EUMVA|nr:hypothetical protein EVAR_92236_1 [Eumeta japonica]